MKHIPRRIRVTSPDGTKSECSDSDFFALQAPLIVLGEPGSGKSELVRAYEGANGFKIYNAIGFSTIASLPNLGSEHRIVVDGLDEIAAYNSAGLPISDVLSKLPNNNFIITCRSADWQEAVNDVAISARFPNKVIGEILPLSDAEVCEFISSYRQDIEAGAFLAEASRRNVSDLLRNPQTLLMLINAIAESGWPNTKTALYLSACQHMAKEDNRIHASRNRQRPSIESLLDIAGLISAQILLSGAAGINADCQGDGKTFLNIADIITDQIAEPLIRSVVSTRLFRSTSGSNLELCHRTIAEFLAARWLSKQLQDGLSFRRLEGLFYGANFIVPSSLRGLHAWLATSSRSYANLLISRDSFGFFRYGDPATLATPQIQHLLRCLEGLAQIDPHFRMEDWQTTFSHGLARPEIKGDILQLIQNPKTPWQLSHLILETLKDCGFVDEISGDLLKIVTDKSLSTSERMAATEALYGCVNPPNWNELVNCLCGLDDMESFRVALEIVENKTRQFTGIEIGQILVGISENEESEHYAGLGYRLEKLLSAIQIEDCLGVLSDYLSSLPQHEKAYEASQCQ